MGLHGLCDLWGSTTGFGIYYLEVDMNKEGLIVKQQLEIEELKAIIGRYKSACSSARSFLWRPEQWNTKCPDFPKTAMSGIVRARQAIDDI